MNRIVAASFPTAEKGCTSGETGDPAVKRSAAWDTPQTLGRRRHADGGVAVPKAFAVS
jgi:hypothetical protein